MHRETASAGNQIDFLKDEIAIAKNERNQLQKEFDLIMKQPFFKKENDQNNLQKLTSLQQQIDQQEAELKKSRANILKYEEEHKELSDEINGLNKDKQFYNEELKKMNTYNDPHGLTVDQI